MDKNSPSMRDSVLKAIQNGRVNMKPKWQYILKMALLIIGIVLVGFTAVYVASFVVFNLRVSGVWFAPGFGSPGLGLFFHSLPWMLIIIAVVFVGLLQLLIKQYSFAYGQPLLYSALAVIILVIAGGIGIGLTPLHQHLNNDRLPFYNRMGQPPPNLSMGTVTAVVHDGCHMHDRRYGNLYIQYTPQTQLPDTPISTGENIVVLGDRDNGTVLAQSIRQISQLPPPPRNHGND